jgi:transposase InsO family protein
MPVPARPNDLWALDFVSDQLVCGRRFHILGIYDVCTFRCLVAIADFPNVFLNERLLTSLAQARTALEEWRHDNNTVRPHAGIGSIMPAGLCRPVLTAPGQGAALAKDSAPWLRCRHPDGGVQPPVYSCRWGNVTVP